MDVMKFHHFLQLERELLMITDVSDWDDVGPRWDGFVTRTQRLAEEEGQRSVKLYEKLHTNKEEFETFA